MPSSPHAIELSGLTKRFGSFTAVDALSFTVPRGSIFGFLGPNGSGKSTCIRMLCGLLQPTAGTATVNGFDIEREPEAVKRSIGYMNQAFSLYRDLTVEENLTFFGGIYGLRGARLKERKDEVIELVGIRDYLQRRAGQLSGGWKQRLALAAALIHEPEVVFLDEPTAGIDPVARRELWDLLFELAAAGRTLFVTTHYMDEAERCDQIAYIYLSRLMVQGTPGELKSLPEVSPEGTRRIAVATARPSTALMALKRQPFALDATLVEAEIHLLLPADTSDDTVLRTLRDAGLTDVSARPIEPSLEDVFVTLTRRLAHDARSAVRL
jgi:ABC-type multidrug transport system ATPase subunit